MMIRNGARIWVKKIGVWGRVAARTPNGMLLIDDLTWPTGRPKNAPTAISAWPHQVVVKEVMNKRISHLNGSEINTNVKEAGR